MNPKELIKEIEKGCEVKYSHINGYWICGVDGLLCHPCELKRVGALEMLDCVKEIIKINAEESGLKQWQIRPSEFIEKILKELEIKNAS